MHLAHDAAANPHTLDLVLHVQCHEWLVAFDADLVEHVALCEGFGGEWLDAPGSRPDRPVALLGSVRFGGRSYAAWDLGLLLGRSSQHEAWVLVRAAHVRADGQRRAVPIALRTGGCRTVGPLPAGSTYRLPPGVSVVRPRALHAAYLPTPAQHGNGPGIVGGVCLDVARLFSADELAISLRLLTDERRPKG